MDHRRAGPVWLHPNQFDEWEVVTGPEERVQTPGGAERRSRNRLTASTDPSLSGPFRKSIDRLSFIDKPGEGLG